MALAGHAQAIALWRRHAYVAAGEGGLRVIDLSTPSAPREVGALPRTLASPTPPPDPLRPRRPPASTPATGGPLAWEPARVAMAGDHLCVASGNRLFVMGLQNPAQPAQVAVYEVGAGINALAAAGRYAYLHCGNECCGGPPEEFRVLDLADPAAPRLVGKVDLHSRYWGGLAVAGERGYLVADGNLHLLDLADPATPRLAATLGAQGTLAGGAVAVAGELVYISAHREGIAVVDASDPANPRLAGTSEGLAAGEDPPATGTAHMPNQLALGGDLACVTLWQGGSLWIVEDGLAVLDLRDPLRPRQVGRLKQPNDASDVALAGRYAYLAAGPGVVVVDLNDPAQPRHVTAIGAPQVPVDSPPRAARCLALAGNTVYAAVDVAGGTNTTPHSAL